MKRRWDFCWGCGAITGFHCARCKHPVCVVLNSPTPAVGCAVLRKAPKRVGVFLLVCSPRCRLRRSPDVLAQIRKGIDLGKLAGLMKRSFASQWSDDAEGSR